MPTDERAECIQTTDSEPADLELEAARLRHSPVLKRVELEIARLLLEGVLSLFAQSDDGKSGVCGSRCPK